MKLTIVLNLGISFNNDFSLPDLIYPKILVTEKILFVAKCDLSLTQWKIPASKENFEIFMEVRLNLIGKQIKEYKGAGDDYCNIKFTFYIR